MRVCLLVILRFVLLVSLCGCVVYGPLYMKLLVQVPQGLALHRGPQGAIDRGWLAARPGLDIVTLRTQFPATQVPNTAEHGPPLSAALHSVLTQGDSGYLLATDPQVLGSDVGYGDEGVPCLGPCLGVALSHMGSHGVLPS